MENTGKSKKILIYLPLIIAGGLFLLKIFSDYLTYLSIIKYYDNLKLFSYIVNWQLFINLLMSCVLPLCVIIFYGKNKKFYKILMIASYVIVGIILIFGIVYTVRWRAYYNGNLNLNSILSIMSISNLIPGSRIFVNFVLHSNFKSFIELLYIANAVFVAIIAANLSKTGEFIPKTKYPFNPNIIPPTAGYCTLSAWQGAKSFEDSPAALVKQELILDQTNNTVLLKMQLKNTGNQNISAVKIDIQCFDPFRVLIGTCQDILLTNINAAPGMLISISSPIILPYNQTRNIEIILKSVSFTDGNIWENKTMRLFDELPQ